MRKSNAIGFGITPGITCRGCSVDCFGMKGLYKVFERCCVEHWEDNLNLAVSDDFIFTLHRELLRKRAKWVRIHTEGDYFNQSYLDNWFALARLFPEKTFYSYTKALDLDWSDMPANFHRIQSEGGEFDHLLDYSLPHARIFKNRKEIEAAGYLYVDNDDSLATTSVKIGLIFK